MFLLTYDDHGGYFDHVAPPQLDAFGLGIRVPMWVVSPLAKRGHIEPTVYEHTSTLKFIERLFGLPTLASINHRFDVATPVGFGLRGRAERRDSRPASSAARRAQRYWRPVRVLRHLRWRRSPIQGYVTEAADALVRCHAGHQRVGGHEAPVGLPGVGDLRQSPTPLCLRSLQHAANVANHGLVIPEVRVADEVGRQIRGIDGVDPVDDGHRPDVTGTGTPIHFFRGEQRLVA